jgi:GTP cyclohydrolase I
MNRIVEYYSKRPQVQERLTMQIVQELQNALVQKTLPALLTRNISVNSRGISDIESSTVTSIGGKFKDPKLEESFWIILN